MECQILEPVNPFTTAGKSPFFPRPGLQSMNLRHALAVLIIFLAALRRTFSGFPSPQTSGGKIA